MFRNVPHVPEHSGPEYTIGPGLGLVGGVRFGAGGQGGSNAALLIGSAKTTHAARMLPAPLSRLRSPQGQGARGALGIFEGRDRCH